MHTLRSVLQRNFYLILAFFLAQILGPLANSLFVEWLQITYGRTPNRILSLLVGALLLTAFFAVLWWWLNRQRKPLDLVPKRLQPSRFPGLVTLVSRPRGVAGVTPSQTPVHELAIQYHSGQEEGSPGVLRVCWLLASEGKAGSMAEAKRIEAAYEQEGILDINIVSIRSAFDLNDTHEAVRDIYTHQMQSYQLKPNQIISDFTGGTKLMSAGMILACQDVWPMEYFQGRPSEIASRPVLIDFHLAPPPVL